MHTSPKPAPLDPTEPERVAEAISRWSARYVVLTTVNRDDLEDFGSGHFAETVRQIKEKNSEILVEGLVGDFAGKLHLIDPVATSGLSVFAHNVETVERLTSEVRDRRAAYRQSIAVLRYAKEKFPFLKTKSSIMVGFGEEREEIIRTMRDLKEAGVDFLTIGQYVRPTKGHRKVDRYLEPHEFENLEKIGREIGFEYLASGPLVRSSYKAGEYYFAQKLKGQ